MRISNFFKRLGLKSKLTVAAVTALAVVAVPIAVQAGFGPGRPVFDWNNPADRKGSATGPVFNSFINTPTYGDERAFVDAKDSTVTSGGYADTINVEGGKEYTIRAYVHNNANQDTNASGLGVAKNTKFRFDVLPGMANGNEVTGYISADNATPKVVYDTVKLKNDTRAFSLEYVPGSARMQSNVHPYPGVALPDSITTTGALIGNNKDGNLPGCFEYTEIITIRVRVKTPNLEINKTVSKVDMPKLTESSESITAKRGDTISWRIDYKNNGTGVIDNIVIRDQIPAGLQLVPGSIKLSTAAGTETLQDTALSSGGVDVGDYFPAGNGVIRFRTKITTPEDVCELKNVAFGRAQNVPEQSNDAKVVIENCNPTQPVYRCDAITSAFMSGNTYRFTTKATALNGATVKQYRYSFTGTGYKQDAISNQANGQIDNTFPGPGTYSAKVTVDFIVNGQTVSHTSNACNTTITIPKEDEKCLVPGKEHLPKDSPECRETPTTLVSTGPGDVAGIFAAVTVAGAVAHRFVLGRRYNG